jgi:hypothetical protein
LLTAIASVLVQSRAQVGFYGVVLIFAAQLVIPADAMNLLISGISIPGWIVLVAVLTGVRLRLDPPFPEGDEPDPGGHVHRVLIQAIGHAETPPRQRHRRSPHSWRRPACSVVTVAF